VEKAELISQMGLFRDAIDLPPCVSPGVIDLSCPGIRPEGGFFGKGSQKAETLALTQGAFMVF
jgi:hypothetical protein